MIAAMRQFDRRFWAGAAPRLVDRRRVNAHGLLSVGLVGNSAGRCVAKASGAAYPRGATHPRGAARRLSGYLLLEVMLALSLLVLGLATIGAQVQRSFDTAYDSHRTLRAMNLVESKLAELESELIPNIDEAMEDELEAEFGRLFPDFGWRLRIDPTQTPELWLVRLDILYQRRLDIDEEEFDFDEAEVIYSVRTLRATPATIDPVRDFGADEETMARLADAFGGLDMDAGNVSPRMLAGLPTDQLVAGLTALQEAGLLQGVDLSAILPPEILEMLDDLSVGAGSDGVDDGSEGGR